MKKIVFILLVTALSVLLCSCGSKDTSSDNKYFLESGEEYTKPEGADVTISWPENWD